MAELYDRYGRLAYGLVLRIVRDEAVAEDLVQEAFLRVWNRAHLLEEGCQSLGPWVLTVARNRAIDHVRSAGGRMARNSTSLEGTDLPDLLCSLDEQVVNAEWADRLRTAFQGLTTHQRQVIELAYYEGLSQSEMAERLAQPLGTVKSWVRTGLKALRAALGEGARS